MTRTEKLTHIGMLLGIESPVGSGDDTNGSNWLKSVAERLNPGRFEGDNVEIKGDDIENFHLIVDFIGEEYRSEFLTRGSDGLEITDTGVEVIHDSLVKWNQLCEQLTSNSGDSANQTLNLHPYMLTREISENWLDDWISSKSDSHTESGEIDAKFIKLSPNLELYAATNHYDILSPSHLQYCIEKLQIENSTEVFEDPTDQVGDKSEDSPTVERISRRIHKEMDKTTVKVLMSDIDDKSLDLNPPWQRKIVWPDAKQRALIRSILLGFPLPSIILFRPKNSAKLEVVDGKQRLTSLHRFINGEIPFPKISDAEDENMGDYNLQQCSDKYIHDPGFPEVARFDIRNASLHTAKLLDVEPETIYQVFTVYNSQGTRLNAIEIRNAAYQDHEIHKAMVSLTGEGHLMDENTWSQWTKDFREVVGNGKLDGGRYKYLGFVERYLGYSRGHSDYGKNSFGKLTTAKSIKAFYDTEDQNDQQNAKAISDEVSKVFSFCNEKLLQPFGFNQKFHALKATNTMIIANLLMCLVEGDLLEESKVIKIINEINQNIRIPDNQNTTTIWGLHIDSVRQIWTRFEHERPLGEHMDKYHKEYLDKLMPTRWG